MRHVHSVTRVALWALISAVMVGVGFAQPQSITNYQLVDDTLISGTWYQYVYSAQLSNTGPALSSATATLSTSVSNIQVVSGKNVLNFGPVSSNGQVTSKNTFTINIDRSQQFKLTDLHWNIQVVLAPPPPVANAGSSQAAVVGTTVTLDGSQSTNPSGIGTLAYSWTFNSVPPGSSAKLVNPTSVSPTFVPDVSGPFVIQLTVSNGKASGSATTTVNGDILPVANAGPNQSVTPGTLVTLDGSKSSDTDGQLLTYSWAFTSIPPGSSAVLSGATTVSPTFIADKSGKYVVQLIVNDTLENSIPSSVTIAQNSPPVANAGPNQGPVTTGTTVHLDGSKSTDVDGDPITYKWSLITLPLNSLATLSNTTTVNPTFVPDLAGTYIAQLIVNDGFYDSSPSTVTINTIPAIQKPIANAGPNQRVIQHALVTLDGSGSSDPQGLPLIYSWSFLDKPTGSAAVLSNPSAVQPTFTSDISGTYVVQLVVFNGTLASDPSTILIAIDIPPVANAGPNQNVKLGASVQLDGSGSIDPNGNGITYSWSLLSRPSGSAAVLSSTTAIKPTFTADVAGTYVAQLIVSDSLQSSNPPSTVTVTVVKKPTANAGSTQRVLPNSTVTLDGSASSDPQGISLTYSWSFTNKPSGSTAVLSGSTTVNPTFTSDASGTYTIQLTVSNGPWVSDPSTVTISIDTPPVANAGPNQNVSVAGTVQLNGSASADPDGDGLTYSWSFTSLPPGSATTLLAANTVGPTFLADVVGAYVVQLIVNDGRQNSSPATVTITAAPPKIITLAPNPLNIPLSGSGTMTATLAAPAGPSGQVVTLANSNPGAAKVPASVTVPANGTSVNFGVTAGALAGTTTITGSAPGFPSTTATVNAVAPKSTVTLDLPTVGLGGQITGHVTLNVPSVSGANALLSSSPTGIVTLPSSVPIPAGGTTGSFTITGAALGTSTVRGAVPGYSSVTALVSVVTEPLINVPNSLTAQATQPPVTLNISLQTPAPNGGITVSLTSSDPTKATVTPSVFIAGGTLTPSTQPTVTGLNVGKVTVNATATGYASGGTAVTVTAGSPVSIKTGGTPQSVSTSSSFSTLTATVQDAFGNPVSGVSVTFTAPTSGPSVTVATTNAITNAAGVASANLIANAIPGGFTVTATSSGLSANYSLTNLSAPPKSIAVSSGSGQSAQILTPFANFLQAIVKDPGNNPLANVVVTFTAPTGIGPSGTFGGGSTATVITDSTGTATSPQLTANGTVSQPGKPYVVKVIIGSNPNLSASFSMTNLPGPPTQIAATVGSGQSATINKTFGNALQATVKDAGGNVAGGVPVTFTAPSGGASGTFAGGFPSVTITTNPSGVAIAPLLTANGIAGTYTVTATFTGGPTTGFALTNNAGPAASIVATAGTPQTGQINAVFTPLQATVTDAGGNPVSGATVSFSAPSTSGAPSGKFGSSSTATATTNANGVATAPTFTADLTVGGPFTVTASVGGVSTPASFFLTNGPGAPTSITATAGTPQTVQAGLAPTTPLKVLVKDIGGNLLNNQVVTFTAPSSGASGTFTGGTNTATATTDSTGTTTAPGFTANGTVGTYTVTASINGLTTTFAMTNKAGPPALIAPAPGASGQTAKLTVAFTTPLAVIVTDATHNPVSGVTVTFTAPNAGPSGTFTGNSLTAQATTDATGKATTGAFTPNLLLGSYAVTATSVNNLSTTLTLTNAVGPPKTMVATSGSGQSAQITAAFANPLVATVTDVAGNLVSGASVIFTAPKSGASLTFAGGSTTAAVTTDANGLATSPIITANGTVSTPTFTVTATSNGASTTFTLTNTAGPPALVTAATGTTPQSAAEGEPFPTKLAVTVTDAGKNPVNGASVTFTAPSGSVPSGLFGATTTATVTTNSSGVATVPLFMANMMPGTYNVTATVTGLTPVTFALTNAVCVPTAPATACPTISVGNLSIGQNLLTNAIVTLAPAAGNSGVNVILSSSDPTKVLLSGRLDDPGTPTLSVPVAAGVTQTGIFVHGLVSSGSAFITASAPGYVFAVGTVTLTPSGFIFSIPSQPSSNNLVTANGGSTPMVLQSVQLDSSLNPIGFQDLRGGFTANVTVTNSNPSVGAASFTSPVTLTADNNPLSFTFTADPSNTGVTTLTAGVPTGFSAPASGSTVTVHVSAAQLTVAQTDPAIGQSLQTTAQVAFTGGGSQPADTHFTITSADPTKLLLSTSPTAAGTASISVKISAGFTKSPSFFLQSLVSSGTVNYTVQATGFPTVTQAANLVPSGIVVFGPGGLGNAIKTTTQSQSSTITVSSYRLDSSNKPVSAQAVAGGLTASSTITSSDTTVGTITVSPVILASNTSSTTTQLQPVSISAGGTITISASVPSGFGTPAADGSVSAIVSEPGMSLSANGSTIGNNLQVEDSLILGAPAPTGGLLVTITSNSPNLMLGVNPTDTGTSSITFTVPAGNTNFPYYLQALTNSGTATYTASAPSFNSKTATINFGNSGVALTGPLGLNAPVYSTTVASGASTWTVYTALLDGGNNFVSAQALRPGMTVVATLTSSNTGVGTIASPVTLNGGGPSSVTTSFTPVGTGATNVTIALPSNLGLSGNNNKVNVIVQ